MSEAMLRVVDVRGHFRALDNNRNQVLHGISYEVGRGTLTAIVGETGSGKTLTSLSALGIAHPTFHLDAGQAWFDGVDLFALGPEEMRVVRGKRIAMVFQDARAALNPVITLGDQLVDIVRLHRPDTSKADAVREVVSALEGVYIPEPERRMKQYAHQISGGMAQRVMIAMALLCEPELLILDEPTTGLDVTIQADIMELIQRIQADRGMTVCLITHDLGVVAETSEHVIVMRAGQVVETGTTQQIITAPAEDYTKQLLAASRLERASA